MLAQAAWMGPQDYLRALCASNFHLVDQVVVKVISVPVSRNQMTVANMIFAYIHMIIMDEQ